MTQADESTVDSNDLVEAPQRSVRISRVAFQDMHHLVLRRLSARAQIRRHAQKLAAWQPAERSVCDLEIEGIEHTESSFATTRPPLPTTRFASSQYFAWTNNSRTQ
jgi:uncharacterized protein (DUF2236 family)